MRVGEKFDAFIDHEAPVEFLEGVTAAGKTTVGIYKFMIKVAESPRQQHIIAGLDTGTIEKNIIDKDHGIRDEWGCLVEYNGNGSKDLKLPHILFHVASGNDKKILILGYDNKTRWQKALGGQYGCLYIDEINIADMDFVREASMRCDYLIGTLNPDDPELPVYKEYINHSRPLPEWQEGTPKEILDDLVEEPKSGWTHWFFNFEDNIALSQEKIQRIKENVPKGTKLWKNKIEGIRGRATGLVFSNFESRHIVTKAWAEQFKPSADDDRMLSSERRMAERFIQFSVGVDTAYSQISPDTIAMSFIGITNKGKCIVLAEKVFNNALLGVPIAPSDTVKNLVDFLEACRKAWGFSRDCFIDSADQATITEAMKYKRTHGCVYNFIGAWKKEKIIDRINNQLGWFADGSRGEPCFFVVDSCENYIHELNTYSWKEDKNNEPQDGNDHMINSVQYAWLPYEKMIGIARR